MKKRNIIILLIILLIIALAIFFFYDREKSLTEKENLKPPAPPGVNIGEAEETEIITGKVTGGGGGGGGSGGSGETTTTSSSGGSSEGNKLPSDLYTRECGYYSDEYDYCGGTCPSGTCVQEGRSCYCKITE